MFTEVEIQQYAFGAVVENGRKLFSRGRVVSLNCVGESIVAAVKGESVFKVVVSKSGGALTFDCTCRFSYGGACEHVVAAMFAANERAAIQVGIDWDRLPDEMSLPESIAEPAVISVPPAEEIPEEPMAFVSDQVIEIEPVRPASRIYLSECDSTLLVELRFAYHDGAVEFSRADQSLSKVVTSDDGSIYRVHRSKAREIGVAASMATYELMHYQTGYYTPVSDPRIWTLHELPRLAADGFQIYGEEQLRAANARKSVPRLGISIKTGDHFFGCTVQLKVDGISATLAALVKAIREGSRFVLLSDGTSGILPSVWVEKFAALFSVVDIYPEKQSLSIRQTHVAVADMLYQMADEKWADATFQKRRLVFRNFEGIESIALPDNLKATMRTYQKSGYDWFYFLKKFRFGGCLADDMGLGKTVQTLALLLKEKELGDGQPSLVVMPTSLLFNWQCESRKFTPALNVLLYHGSNRQQYVNLLTMADVVLTSYGTVLRDIDLLSGVTFHFCILDEAQAIKNPSSQITRALQQLKSTYKIALSGTPIENNLSELWSLFSFLNPGMLGSYRSFAQNFVKPVEKEGNEFVADVLRKLIFPFILRRTKQQAAQDLPQKNEIVLYTDMLPAQKTLYDITKEIYRGKVASSIDERGVDNVRFQVLEGLLRLRQICCHPALFDKEFSGDSGKFRVLEESITDIVSEGHKILVFSQFVAALQLLRDRINKRGIASELLTGSSHNRQQIVERFQSDRGAPVFFISLKAGGTGLNLTAADYVFHVDPWWNPSAENQASDRAYRIGQTRNVFVYKVITRDSIEERVLELQERKRTLMESVIQTESSLFKQLSKNDILDLFK